MAKIQPIPAICFRSATGDIGSLIAPPYDVLDEANKQSLLAINPQNIVKIDLPFTPPKVVGPDHVYEEAGQIWRSWLREAVLIHRKKPAMFVYQQTFRAVAPQTGKSQTLRRRGIIVNVGVQAFARSSDSGGIWPHEQTFASGKEDRLRLMRATRAQLSPIFGIFRDPKGDLGGLLSEAIEARPADLFGTTTNDNVLHQVWVLEHIDTLRHVTETLADKEIYIADGHHRYNTALNYLKEIGRVPADHPARFCMFVLVAQQDPGLIVLPTHRVLGGMRGYSLQKFVSAAAGRVRITVFNGDLTALAAALPEAGDHGIGLIDCDGNLAIATTDPDPLAATHPDTSDAWRRLDVAIAAHLIVEQICEPVFSPHHPLKWQYPHDLASLKSILAEDDFQLGLVMQATPLEAVMQVSKSRELMPPKSTFFAPKLATGLVINRLEQVAAG